MVDLPKSKGVDDKLYVVTCIINPCRYLSRYNLYQNFEKMVRDSGAILYTVEVAFGHRPFKITTKENPNHIQLRTWTELWHKENALNIGFSRLPQDWKYGAWIDADISFARQDWVSETLHQLQHYYIVQLFDTVYDLSPKYTPYQKHNGFIYSYLNKEINKNRYDIWHPGFGWAIRKHTFNELGCLMDWPILGAADRHMAFSLINNVDITLNTKLSNNYKLLTKLWQERANSFVKKNIGYIPGTIFHYWHGKKCDRKYKERWQILIDNDFDPLYDLKRDWQGLWQLTDRNIKLRDDLRNYFRQRNEDSIDMV